jgi:hypothetical protein
LNFHCLFVRYGYHVRTAVEAMPIPSRMGQ